MIAFKDHFSSDSAHYAAFRPDYPTALFGWLASLCAEHDIAWDCATGNGQAALGLTRHFSRVIATDASSEQIHSATSHPGIEYRVAPAEDSHLQDQSIDLITVAQAAHWFDLPYFYDEASRVLKPGGVLALWAYGLARIEPRIDVLITHFYTDTVGPCWPPERVLIDEGYRSLPFPFDEMPTPMLTMQAEWDLNAFIGYLSTWSAVKRYRATHGLDPLSALVDDLKPLWGFPETRKRLQWPVFLRVGRV